MFDMNENIPSGVSDRLSGGGIVGGGILGGLYGDMLGGGDPTSQALKKALGVGKEYLSPFIDRGGRAGGIAEREYGSLVDDPAAMLEKFMSGYQPSKYYDVMQERLGQAASNTAAAGGMRGSPYEQTQQQELTQALLSKDMQNYLSQVMGLYGEGLSGEKSLYGTGFEGARSLSSDAANIYGSQAQLAEARAREERERADRREERAAQDDGGFADFAKAGASIAGMFI